MKNFKKKCQSYLEIIKFSLAVAGILLAVSASAQTWRSINSDMERDAVASKYYYLETDQKVIDVTQQIIDDNHIDANIIGEISDENFGNNKDLSGYTLNFKDMQAPTRKFWLFGAGSKLGNVSQNIVNLTDIKGGHDMDVRGGHSYKGVSSGNAVNVVNSKVDEVKGGSTNRGSAINNKVTIGSNSEVRVVHGGLGFFNANGEVKGNEVSVSGSNAFFIYGGESQSGTISKNKVVIKADGAKRSLSRGVFGGMSASGRGDVLENEVFISGSDVERSYGRDIGVYGGKSNVGRANLNKVTITSDANGKSVIGVDIFGGASGSQLMGDPRIQALQNEVNIIGSDVRQIYGGKTPSGDASANKVTVKSDGVNRSSTQNICGGKSDAGSANENLVSVLSSDVKGDVYGGVTGFGLGHANSNVITLDDATVSGGVYGGYNDGYVGDTVNNVVNLKNNVVIAGDLSGGYGTGSDDYITGNTLNIYSKSVKAGNILNFENINFFLPKSVTNGDKILTLTGKDDTDLSKTNISAKIDNEARLEMGDKFALIDKEQGHITAPKKMINANQGISNTYQLSLEASDHQIVAKVEGKSYNPKQKNLAETSAGMQGMLQSGSDLSSSQGKSAMMSSLANTSSGSFGAAGASSVKLKSGSYVKSKGINLVAGLSKQVNDTLSYGAFVELGLGSYDSFNSFGGASVKGSGNSRYYGVGLMSNFDLANRFYIESSARAGKIRADYKSEDFDGYVPSYKSTRTYYGFSLGGGKIVEINEISSLDLYVKAFYNRMLGDEVEILNTQYKFKAVNSIVGKLGMKFNQDINENSAWYIGGAYEREFDGKAKARNLTFSQDITAPSMRGNTGVGEIGFKFLPKQNLQIDLNLQGLVGKRQGISGGLKIDYKI
ncbi:autotransporter outer membrane beta-barrel domain-containing protein [Campylobacter curvus]|uniref:autotransporter outer membrane beta-barrel domain-containing protein n=1 Tax=Campylobacter curvus TaxID=200 RepID=UPI00147028B3|nr:autotransporter outer membrane beta-barrel domain-containing protein [Campylobacter curvus]